MSKYLVTSALPYANGPIHLGHLAGAYLPADIYVRFRKINKDDVIYICGTDEHGVPITLKADKEGVSPKVIVDRYHDNIKNSFRKMRIDFDNFSGTSREKHHYDLSQKFFLNLLESGHIITKEEEQFYCENEKRFLPDRYIEGKCPFCNYEKARGDQCDKCGKLLNPTELVSPYCANCNSKPVLKKTIHWYFKLQDFEKKLIEWLKTRKNWKDNVVNFVLGWIEKEGLRERAITRDLEWGVPVPLEEAKNKVLYVWFDAPIGYISSTIEWAEKTGNPDKWKEYWLNPDTKLVHFIGKDNIPFHAIIWPAMLMGQKENYVLPYDIPANEYLTLEGDKFSTSLNWAVWVDEYLEVFPPDPLRYFLAANAPENKDADFSWKAFQSRNNDELANILGNFVNRTLTFIFNNLNGVIPEGNYIDADNEIFNELEKKVLDYTNCLDNYKVREASKIMMDIARIGNKYFDEMKPWVLKNENIDRMKTVLNMCMNIMRVLCVCMYPIIPDSAEKLWKMMGENNDILQENWKDLPKKRVIPGNKINKPEILFVKYDDEIIKKQIDKLISKSKQNTNKEINQTNNQNQEKTEYISIDEFKKLDIRVAEIISVADIEKSNKLLKLKVKVGNIEKQIIAGIKKYYNKEDLIGKKIIIINNLQPAKLAGEISEGMVLAASDDETNKIVLLTVESDIKSGAKIS